MESDDGGAAQAAATVDGDAGASSSREPALKRQRTDGGGVSVKKEKQVDAESAFEQIDVINALGDGGGRDVIAEFESNWTDDHGPLPLVDFARACFCDTSIRNDAT